MKNANTPKRGFLPKVFLIAIVAFVGAGLLVWLGGGKHRQASTPPTPAPETPEPSPTPVAFLVTGPTIPGETLSLGGKALSLQSIPGERIAHQIEAAKKGWRIVTDENGEVSYFRGHAGEGGETQIVVLAQGPEGVVWDEENALWRKSDSVVVLPDVILPGDWDEKSQRGRPYQEASAVFLFVDEEGRDEVGILYGPEAASQMPAEVKEQLITLPDGSALYVTGLKEYSLGEGEQILREEDGSLRFVKPDGSYLVMRTSWANVTSREEGYQVGEFAGPFAESSDIPYPQDSFLENLGLEAKDISYKKGDDKPVIVAKVQDEQGNEKEIVVAAAMPSGEYYKKIKNYDTSKEGWYVWVPTVPVELKNEAVVVEDLRFVESSLIPEAFGYKSSDSAIQQFVNAMAEKGIQVDPKEVVENLQFKVLHDKDGKPFVVGVYNLDPDPQKSGETLEGPIPLFIAEQDENGEWRWREFGLATFDNRHGIAFDEWDLGLYRDPAIQKFVVNTFGTVFPTGAFMPRYVEQYGDRSQRFFVDSVKRHPTLSLYIHPGFWDLDYPSSLDNAQSNEEIIEVMRQQVRHYLQVVQRIRNAGGAPVKINFINEPWWADPPNNPINIGWKTYSVYYRPYGRNLIIEAYLMYYEEAQKMDLKIGEDFSLFISVDGIFFPNKKLNFVLNEVLRAKKEIGRRLNVSPSQVPLGLAIQWRFDKNVTGPKMSDEGRYKLPTPMEIEDALKKIRRFESENGIKIPVNVTEFELVNLTPREREEIMKQFVEIALKYGVESITYWDLARSYRNPSAIRQNPWIGFDFHRTSYYYEFLQFMYEKFLQSGISELDN